MSLEIYKADLTNRYEIPHAESIQTQVLYNGIGKCQIVVAANDYFVNAIDKNGLLYDTDKNVTYTIQDVWKDTTKNQIIANGYTANWLLNKRTISIKQLISNVEIGVYSAVNGNLRNLPRVSTAAIKGLTATTEDTLYGGQLLDRIIPVLDKAEYGHRMVWSDDTKAHTFEIYQGQDLTPDAAGIHAIVFSEGQGTATDLVFEDDDSVFKNYFYVLCKKLDGTEEVVEYGDSAALDRRECWLSGTITQSQDEPIEELRKRAQQKCREEATKRLKRQRFNVRIDPSELGIRFNIGDKVACASERLGVEFEARITGVTYKMDVTGEKTEINLGEPRLTALGEELLKLG